MLKNVKNVKLLFISSPTGLPLEITVAPVKEAEQLFISSATEYRLLLSHTCTALSAWPYKVLPCRISWLL